MAWLIVQFIIIIYLIIMMCINLNYYPHLKCMISSVYLTTIFLIIVADVYFYFSVLKS